MYQSVYTQIKYKEEITAVKTVCVDSVCSGFLLFVF